MTRPHITDHALLRAAEIAQVIGEAQALRLLSARGGTQIEIPKRAAGSKLAEIVGEIDAHRLIEHFGHGRLDLPMGEGRGIGARRARAKRMLAAGASLTKTALACELTVRAVSRYKAQQDAKDRRQLPLFDFDADL